MKVALSFNTVSLIISTTNAFVSQHYYLRAPSSFGLLLKKPAPAPAGAMAPLFLATTRTSGGGGGGGVEELFEDEKEMIPIADGYLRAKYRATISAAGHKVCDKERGDATEMLRSILPPVTPEELEKELQATLSQFPGDTISEDDFVSALLDNSYWQSAGPLVVKELIYFDALYAYYKTGKSLLENDDYEALKDNLSWEGSSVAMMNANEAMFVTAIASSKRGQPIMDDEEYATLKKELQKQDSWVTARGQDALERLGLDTFLGYLHRALL
jgi:hypothetical protein